jgi:ATP-dependent helicase/nuclease subunit A
LSRTWNPLALYGETLESQGIPVVLAGGGNLLDTREAKDAWALLRFLADPTDDIALVSVLRSPFFAISDRTLFMVSRSFESLNGNRPCWWEQIQKQEHQKPGFLNPIPNLKPTFKRSHRRTPHPFTTTG